MKKCPEFPRDENSENSKPVKSSPKKVSPKKSPQKRARNSPIKTSDSLSPIKLRLLDASPEINDGKCETREASAFESIQALPETLLACRKDTKVSKLDDIKDILEVG